MLILTLRTDKPEAELGLYLDGRQINYTKWQAHRELAETIHQQLANLLLSQPYELQNIDGIVVFKGPGSFTGLRIGLSVGNALACALQLSIVASKGHDWVQSGIKKLRAGENDHVALPEYGAVPHITSPKK